MEPIPNQPQPPRKRIKLKLIATIILLAVGFGGYGYMWYKNTRKIRTEALQILDETIQLRLLHETVANERARCSSYVTLNEGIFAEFEYCKKFIEWADSILVQ